MRNFFVIKRCWLKYVDGRLMFVFMTRDGDNTVVKSVHLSDSLTDVCESKDYPCMPYNIMTVYNELPNLRINDDDSIEIRLSYGMFDKLELV